MCLCAFFICRCSADPEITPELQSNGADVPETTPEFRSNAADVPESDLPETTAEFQSNAADDPETTPELQSNAADVPESDLPETTAEFQSSAADDPETTPELQSNAADVPQSDLPETTAEFQSTPELQSNAADVPETTTELDSSSRISLLAISPYPKVFLPNGAAAPRKRGAEVASVVTSSPYKRALVEKSASKKGTCKVQPAREVPKEKDTVHKKKKGVTKKETAQSKRNVPKKKSVRKNTAVSKERKEGSYYCIYCNAQCIEDALEEDWLQCCKCEEWCHESCAPIDIGTQDFTCDFCLH